MFGVCRLRLLALPERAGGGGESKVFIRGGGWDFLQDVGPLLIERRKFYF